MILESTAELHALLAQAKSIAVVGASPKANRPSYEIFAFLRTLDGLEVAPVNPAARQVAGVTAFPSLQAYASERGAPDIVNVFRKPTDALKAALDAVAVGAKAIWFQYGVVNESAIALANEAGLSVVVDRCIKTEFRRMAAA